jgi:hypothetical protein
MTTSANFIIHICLDDTKRGFRALKKERGIKAATQWPQQPKNRLTKPEPGSPLCLAHKAAGFLFFSPVLGFSDFLT